MCKRNQILSVDIDRDQVPKWFHTFRVTLEFADPISYDDAASILQQQLQKMCDKGLEKNIRLEEDGSKK